MFTLNDVIGSGCMIHSIDIYRILPEGEQLLLGVMELSAISSAVTPSYEIYGVQRGEFRDWEYRSFERDGSPLRLQRFHILRTKSRLTRRLCHISGSVHQSAATDLSQNLMKLPSGEATDIENRLRLRSVPCFDTGNVFR